MSRQLKRWESPRREGRNDKGRGGSARQRQRQKQLKALKQKLKQANSKNKNIGGEGANLFPLLLVRLRDSNHFFATGYDAS